MIGAPGGPGFAARLVRGAWALAALALLLIAGGPLGWRVGLWHYAVSFALIRWAAYGALLGLGLALAALVGWRRLGARQRWALIVALPCCAILFLMPSQYRLAAYLSIHDISTDTDDPPPFAAVLPARAAARAASADYAGPALAATQRAAYPDIQPRYLDLPPDDAFARALATARAMPRWTIVASDPAAGRIEASARTFWMGFVDDVAIRVAPAPQGSRIDMRSLSRVGRGDFGANAARIRAYFARLGADAGSAG